MRGGVLLTNCPGTCKLKEPLLLTDICTNNEHVCGCVPERKPQQEQLPSDMRTAAVVKAASPMPWDWNQVWRTLDKLWPLLLLKSQMMDCQVSGEVAQTMKSYLIDLCHSSNQTDIDNECIWIEDRCGTDMTGTCMKGQACTHKEESSSIVGGWICDFWDTCTSNSTSSLLQRTESSLMQQALLERTRSTTQRSHDEQSLLERTESTHPSSERTESLLARRVAERSGVADMQFDESLTGKEMC